MRKQDASFEYAEEDKLEDSSEPLESSEEVDDRAIDPNMNSIAQMLAKRPISKR